MTTTTSSTRLGLLVSLRLAANGAFRFLYPFLPVVARDLGLPPARAGLLVASLAVGGMLSPVLRGWLVGPGERTRLLLVSSSVVLGVGTAIAAAAPVAVVAVGGLLVLGAGKPLLDSASISYVAARTSFARRARATSIMELTWAGALVLVAPLAGLLAGATSWRWPLALLGVTVAAVAVGGRGLLDRDPARRARGATAAPTVGTTDDAIDGPIDAGADVATDAASPVDSTDSAVDAGTARGMPVAVEGPSPAEFLRRGMRRASRGLAGLTPTARRFLLVVAFVFAALEATFSVFGLWLDQVHGVSVEQLGAFAAVTATGELVGSAAIAVFADRIGKARALLIGLAICAVGLLGLTMLAALPLAITALAIGLVGSEMGIVAAIAIASEIQPDDRSRYLAIMFAVTSATRAVVGGVGPAVFSATGIAGNVAMSIAAAGLAAVLLRRAVAHSPHLAG